MLVIKFDQVRGMYLISWFPCVIAFRVSFSFDEVLEPSRLSVMMVIDNALHFVFFFSVDKVRWWSGKVWSM